MILITLTSILTDELALQAEEWHDAVARQQGIMQRLAGAEDGHAPSTDFDDSSSQVHAGSHSLPDSMNRSTPLPAGPKALKLSLTIQPVQLAAAALGYHETWLGSRTTEIQHSARTGHLMICGLCCLALSKHAQSVACTR